MVHKIVMEKPVYCRQLYYDLYRNIFLSFFLPKPVYKTQQNGYTMNWSRVGSIHKASPKEVSFIGAVDTAEQWLQGKL